MVRRPKPEVEIEAEVIVPSTWRGWGWPEKITVFWSDDGVNYRVEGQMTDDGPILSLVHLSGNVKPEHLRGPFTSIMRNSFAKAALGEERLGGGFSRKAGVRIRVPVGSGRPVDPGSARQRLNEVARIWKRTDRGSKGQAIADHFKISVGYARKLVSEARQKGYLDETEGTA